jgi:hypothetical protein
MKIPPVGAEFDADGQADMAKLMTQFTILWNGLKRKKIQFNTLKYNSHVRNVCKIFQFCRTINFNSPIRKLKRFVQNWNVTAVYSENLMKHLVHSV